MDQYEAGARLFEQECPRHGIVPFKDKLQHECMVCVEAYVREREAVALDAWHKEFRLYVIRARPTYSDLLDWIEVKQNEATRRREGT